MRIIFVLALITVACLFAVAEEQKEPIQVYPIVWTRLTILIALKSRILKSRGPDKHYSRSTICDPGRGGCCWQKGTQRRKDISGVLRNKWS